MSRKIWFKLLTLLIGVFCFSLPAWCNNYKDGGDHGENKYAIIPKPVSLKPLAGRFILTPQTKIKVSPNIAELRVASDYLVNLIHNSTGYALKYSKREANNKTILFLVDDSIRSDEGYTLHVTSNKIIVKSKTGKGAFFAVQTLRQLMPPEIETKASGIRQVEIPAVKIEDEPRFAYRGVMLDVARHYFPVEFIKEYIDLLAFYKINTLHLHLTDDQGWRIEIKKYPKLQQVAAWRDETIEGHNRDKPERFDGKRYGGYYTQNELRALVKYAQDRFITIIPEIEMPGHSRAAVSAYPELSCKDTTYQVGTRWGRFKDIYCPKPETFKFLENVLIEVMDIFPSKYIHVGGDEVSKDRWEESEFVQNLMDERGLKNEKEVQSYFIQRMEKFLNSKGRTIIGWDEIVEGGLAPNATVMSWRGEEGGIAAAKRNHDVIMTPNTYMYFDYYQTQKEREIEPVASGRFPLPLEKVYSYNPTPAGLTAEEAEHILGVQANLWTEYITTGKHAEHMSFPRVCALAEVGWTPGSSKDYNDFILRLQQNVKHLKMLNVNFSNYYQQTK